MVLKSARQINAAIDQATNQGENLYVALQAPWPYRVFSAKTWGSLTEIKTQGSTISLTKEQLELADFYSN